MPGFKSGLGWAGLGFCLKRPILVKKQTEIEDRHTTMFWPWIGVRECTRWSKLISKAPNLHLAQIPLLGTQNVGREGKFT